MNTFFTCSSKPNNAKRLRQMMCDENSLPWWLYLKRGEFVVKKRFLFGLKDSNLRALNVCLVHFHILSLQGSIKDSLGAHC